MMKPRWLWIFVWLAGAAFSSAADESPTPAPQAAIQGPNVRPGYPDAFAFGYKLAEDSASPDGKYGVIHADSGEIADEIARDFLVALKPFRILAANEGRAYRTYHGHSPDGMTVEWAKDSSAALVTVEGKWGPVGFTLFELHDGRVTRQTDLFPQIERLLQPGLRQSKIKMIASYVWASSGGVGITLEENDSHIDADGRRIHFDLSGTSNPKPMEPPIDTWHGHLVAVWSIPEARWLTHKLTNHTNRQ